MPTPKQVPNSLFRAKSDRPTYLMRWRYKTNGFWRPESEKGSTRKIWEQVISQDRQDLTFVLNKFFNHADQQFDADMPKNDVAFECIITRRT